MSELGQAIRTIFAQLDPEDLDWLRAAIGVPTPDPMATDQLLTSREAAVLARVNVETIRRNVRAGTLEAERTGSRIKIRQSNLERWMVAETSPIEPVQLRRPSTRTLSVRSPMSDAFRRVA
jgi:excisionase family DNA binding protein